MRLKIILIIILLPFFTNSINAQDLKSRQAVAPALRFLPDADVSKISRKYLDVPYADKSIFQKLDVFLP